MVSLDRLVNKVHREILGFLGHLELLDRPEPLDKLDCQETRVLLGLLETSVLKDPRVFKDLKETQEVKVNQDLKGLLVALGRQVPQVGLVLLETLVLREQLAVQVRVALKVLQVIQEMLDLLDQLDYLDHLECLDCLEQLVLPVRLVLRECRVRREVPDSLEKLD